MPETSVGASPVVAAKKLAWLTGDKIFGAFVAFPATAAIKLLGSLGWFATCGLFLVISSLIAIAIMIRNQSKQKLILEELEQKFAPLTRWSKLTETTDLIAYFEQNAQSDYMPAKIFERELVRDLAVMGNGCGKWARSVANEVARTKFRQIQAARGQVRFLASCPIYLADCSEPEKIEKARKNSKSLMILREFMNEMAATGGRFEIRTYEHLATLRLIILDNNECIVGHYQENGVGESLETPLLVFKGEENNEWGFKHAFLRLFDSEWHRASAPTDEDWRMIKEISEKSVIS